MATQMNYDGKAKYQKQGGTGGEPFQTHALTNFDGGRTTKRPSRGPFANGAQMNYEIGESIPVKFEKGQGQKPGTGSMGGY